jgi:hypothetical protein
MFKRIVLILFVVVLPIGAVEACGIPVPQGGDLGKANEQGIVIWDGTVEQVLMEMTITGDADEAAWIFPSPSPATAQLGDPGLFEELEQLTKPLVVIEHRPATDGLVGGAPPPGSGVTVLSEQRLGPFEVASLAATDTGVLQQWLSDNGYPFPPEISPLMQPYIDQQWYFTALRTIPESTTKLVGQLDPIWLTFETTEMVYTLRASSLATEPFPINLYVLADHRVLKSASFGDSQVTFADFVDPDTLPVDSALKPLLPRRMFLTKFHDVVDPTLVTGDYFFTFAGKDETYRATETQIVYDATPNPLEVLTPTNDTPIYPVAGLLLIGACCVGVGLGLGAAFIFIRRQRKA